MLVIDRRTGHITKWPALPLDQLAVHYARYRTGQAPGEMATPEPRLPH